MVKLGDVISTLLLRNNYVIIPSLGGFVANNVAAKIDFQKGIIHPAKKSVSFNKNLQNNDGLLINHLAEVNQMSYQEAETFVHREVQEIKNVLQQEQRVNFENVGFLYINNVGKIAFEQDRFFNLLLASFGMESVLFIEERQEEKEVKIEKEILLPPIDRKEKSEEVATIGKVSFVDNHREEGQKTITRNIGKMVRYAAVAALTPILFYSFWIPMKTDVLQSRVLYSFDFNPFKSDIEAQYKVDSDSINTSYIHPTKNLRLITENITSSTPVFTYPLDDDLFVPVKAQEENNLIVFDENETNSSSAFLQEKERSYHLIVGCFTEKKNADNLISQLKSEGYEAYEVDVKGGLHRISAGYSSDKIQIRQLKKQLELNNHFSWVLKK